MHSTSRHLTILLLELWRCKLSFFKLASMKMVLRVACEVFWEDLEDNLHTDTNDVCVTLACMQQSFGGTSARSSSLQPRFCWHACKMPQRPSACLSSTCGTTWGKARPASHQGLQMSRRRTEADACCQLTRAGSSKEHAKCLRT